MGLDVGVTFPATGAGLGVSAMKVRTDLLPADGGEHRSLVVEDSAGQPEHPTLRFQEFLQSVFWNYLGKNKIAHRSLRAV